jgi:hypothetical protein
MTINQEIENRADLFSMLGNVMNSSYEQINQNQKNEYKNNFVKSFLLESDWKISGLIEREQEEEYLTDLFSLQPYGKKTKECSASLTELLDQGVYKIEWNWNGENISLFLDTNSDANRRFWKAYSVSKANILDDLLNRLIDSKVNIDRNWLWTKLLQDFQGNYEARGFRLEHNRSYFSDNHQGEPFSLKVLGEKEKSDELLRLLNGSETLKDEVTLANIRLKNSLLDQNDQFSIETVYSNGKLTTHGTSIQAHNNLLTRLQRIYLQKVNEIEEKFIIDMQLENEQSIQIRGEPIIFNLSRCQIDDIDYFCKVIFSGNPPFKLWGIPRPSIGGEGRIINAVDFHNGGKIFFEVYNNIICMYLSKGACGNTAIRFFANIQKTYSQLVEAKDVSDHSIF